ncbi:MAG TPA: hypothetical protein VFC23_09245, partial [Thermoanaerobaculia bacterium]|nr:hypothetical protein [Thermoanaerobaculia bacterium]
MNARALTARKTPDGEIQLILPEQETRGPAGHVRDPILKDNGVAIGCQRAPQRRFRIDVVARLFEVRDPQTL